MLRFVITTIVLSAAAALAAPREVTVKTLEGQSAVGRLASLSTQSVTVESATGEKSFAAKDILWIEFPSASLAAEKPSVWLDLVDGSQLAATSFTSSAGAASVQLASGLSVEFPTRLVRTVRFRQQTTPTLVAQWREIAGSTATGDMVVIRKSTMRAGAPDGNEPAAVDHSLDQLEGTLLEVGPESVQFEFDGDKINVRRERLEGLVYFQPTKREFSPPLCRLADSGGSTWLVREYRFENGSLAVTSLGGVTFQSPLATISKLDFSAGNIVFLADLEADSGDGEPPISLQPPGMTTKFGRLFHVRASPPLGADAFRIGDARYDSGLSLHSPLTLVYRVPEGFAHFRAVAGVDNSIVAPGDFLLVIKGDGQELLRHPFTGDSVGGRVPLPIDLDVSRIRRLTIHLDPADGQDIGDQLNLCEARFTK